jgi:hypothetical protein
MTVETQTKSVIVSGNDSATSFSFSDLVIAANTELVVTHVTTAKVETTTALTTDYTVTVASYPGTGTITFPAGGSAYSTLATGEKLIIKRVVTLEQTVDLENQGGYFPDTQEAALDKTVYIALQQQEEIDRTLKIPRSATAVTSVELPTPIANQYILYNADATGFTTTGNTEAQWLGGNGTVSAPYYSFSADPNTGLYRIGADNIGMALGGAKIVDFAAAKTMFASTVEAGADTSTGDNAAMGYTSAEGLILTGQGSTNDITLKNDADTIVAKIPTGTTNLDVIGNITGADLTLSGDLTVNGTTISLQITNQVTADPLIEINNGAGSNANDLGVIMERGSTGDNIFVGWDESADEFIAATTTGTGSSTGNLTLAGYANAKFANVSLAQLTATSGTLAGITSLAMSAGATLTAGFLDQDDMSSNSAVAGVTQQSVKAYVDAAIKAPGIQMTWEANTTDTDQGVGKIWANNGTLASASVLYIDDVDAAGVSINAFVDTLDDPTASNSALIYVAEAGSGSAGVVFKVSGGVTSASTYSKVAVTHVATIGTLADGDSVGMVVAYSGDNGSLTDPMTTRGDIIYRNSSNATARLAVGGAGQALTSDGTDASWTTLAGGGPSKGTAPSTFYRTNGKVQNENLTISNNSATFSATNATNLLDKGTNNGFADDMNVRLTGSDLPNGWLADTDYFVRDVASSTLKLALTIGGSAVTISDDGSGTNTIFEVINATATGPITIKTGNSLTIPSGSRVVIQ